MKVKKGDTVLVTVGKDKGKRGEVLRVVTPSSSKNGSTQPRVVVKGVNMAVKHVKKTREQKGERIEREAPIHISNVMVICPETKNPVRVGYEIPKEGKKYRVSVKGRVNLEKPFVKS